MKPTLELINEWCVKAKVARLNDPQPGVYEYTLAELAASWGAEQARDEANNTPSTEHCLWARNGHTPCQHTQQVQALQTTEEPELPEAVGYMNAGHVHELTQRRISYGYVYPKKETGASVAVYTADQMHDHYQAGVRAGQSQDAKLEPLVRAALCKAFSFGQRYWQQADSEYVSHHKKADETQRKFLALIEETIAAMQGGQK